MAVMHEIVFSSEIECLRALLAVFGEYPARDPVPSWIDQDNPKQQLTKGVAFYEGKVKKPPDWLPDFQSWYASSLSQAAKEGVAPPYRLIARTEAFTFADDDDDDYDAFLYAIDKDD